MKRSLKNITGYSIQGKNGPKGKVKDFLFDEESWIIRYIEARFKETDDRKRVLIPKGFLNDPDWQNEHFPLSADKETIESGPDVDAHAPVSREYEKELSKHYNIDHYWPYIYTAPAGAAVFYPPRPMRVPTKKVSEEDLDTSLRSFQEVRGYHIRATDDRLGEVEDLIVDDSDWQVVYLIVDTSRWRPWSKTVVLSVDWLESISYVMKEVTIDLDTEQIKSAPEYDPSHPIEMDYERALNDYYESLFEKKRK